VATVVRLFRYYAGWADKLSGRNIELSVGGRSFHAYTLKEPVGVAALIIPWNLPLLLVAWKVAPAQAVGCSCILKPVEETPLTALWLGKLCVEAGVINVVTGYGHETGAALTAHDGVDKVPFTGSTEVGREIVYAATGNLKKVTLELGGKSPVVILDDAGLSAAIPAAAGRYLPTPTRTARPAPGCLSTTSTATRSSTASVRPRAASRSATVPSPACR
jgi:phenylacetaldehyde dehydrogenase